MHQTASTVTPTSSNNNNYKITPNNSMLSPTTASNLTNSNSYSSISSKSHRSIDQLSISDLEITKPKSSSSSSTNQNVVDFKPEEIANQLTLLDFRHFKNITPEELDSNVSWNTKNKFKISPNIVSLTQRFNHTVLFVQTEILKHDYKKHLKKRKDIIVYFIRVGSFLLANKLKNYHSLVAIVAALQSTPIYRLQETWQRLKKDNSKDYEVWEGLKEFTSIEERRKNLRDKTSEIDLPCLPFLGMYIFGCKKIT